MSDASKSTDSVDGILAQWQQERPDLNVDAMGAFGRVKRCAVLMQQRMDQTFAQFELSSWEFDVLATLRRSGAPHCLAPTALFSSLMVTSGTMTHRLKGLESKGYIDRLANEHDARSRLVRLSASGLALIDRAVSAHVQNQHQVLAALGAEQRECLDAGLTQLLQMLESGPIDTN